MNYQEVNELLDYLSVSYKIETPTSMLNAWLDVLQEYDYEEVKNSLGEAMSEDRFQRTPPQVQYIVRNLIKKYDKVDYSKQVVYCPICRKPLNQPDYEKHFDRCSSVEYVIRESKKWFHRDLTKKFLFELSDEEFDLRYNKLLQYIYEHTTDESEKTRIGFIFNPPSEEKAREFLKNGA